MFPVYNLVVILATLSVRQISSIISVLQGGAEGEWLAQGHLVVCGTRAKMRAARRSTQGVVWLCLFLLKIKDLDQDTHTNPNNLNPGLFTMLAHPKTMS